MPPPSRNIIGPIVSRLRTAKGLSQQALASRVAVLGYDLTRGTLAKIEAGIRSVSDVELFLIAHSLSVDVQAFAPPNLLQLIKEGALRPFHVRKNKRKKRA